MAFKHLLFPTLLLLLFSACSTTSQLPEGQVLYTGIKQITYSQEPVKPSKVRRDSVGVITTISDAVNAIDDAFSGKGGLGARLPTLSSQILLKPQRSMQPPRPLRASKRSRKPP